MKPDTDNYGAFSQDEDSVQYSREGEKASAERMLEEVRAKYEGRSLEETSTTSVSKNGVQLMKEVIYSYPKLVIDGDVQVIYGMQNNDNELPRSKEYLTAAVYQLLSNEKLILLPRYMDVMLRNVFGSHGLVNYSLSDGISAVSEDGRTFEFKMFGWDNRYGNAKDALDKADVGILVTRTSAAKAYHFMSEYRIKPGKTLFLLSVGREGNIISALKKGTSPNGEALVAKIQWSQPQSNANGLISIEDYIRKMPDVNINDQTPMDYSLIENGRFVNSQTSSQSDDTMLTQKVNDPETVRK